MQPEFIVDLEKDWKRVNKTLGRIAEDCERHPNDAMRQDRYEKTYSELMDIDMGLDIAKERRDRP